MDIGKIKCLDMVDFLNQHYGISFQSSGSGYVSVSPFTNEKNPSFVVRQLDDGHWLFKDFSSGNGGSLIDFVLLKEGYSEVYDAIKHIDQLSLNQGLPQTIDILNKIEQSPTYNIEDIYSKILTNDNNPSQQYLLNRGINAKIIEDLCNNDILLHNQYNGISYCCFAVFNKDGDLTCLDNHEINGNKKYVLGKKEIFTRDWEILPKSEEVFICESIIDYLSMKTIYEDNTPGIALLGNVINFLPELLDETKVIISSLDGDRGGLSCLLDLQEMFPDKKFSVCNYGDDNKDPNEYLQSEKKCKESKNLTSEDKLSIYKDYMKAKKKDKKKIALKWGINRTYMYQIVNECENFIRSGFSERRRGRKPSGAPSTLNEAILKISKLEDEKLNEAKEKERLLARSEFLKVRLKWSEIEASELRKENKNKKQIKKKKKKIC